MYGTNTTKIDRDGRPPLYKCALTFAEVKERRTQLVLSSISFDAADPSRRVERFMVAGIGPVCAEFCRCAHGVPISAWNLLLAAARAGRLQAGMEWDAAGEEMDYADLHDSGENAVTKEETIEWWVLWLSLEDQMPNEPVITHRVVVWDGVHKLEYSADMEWFGTTAPLSRSRWTTLRHDALVELSAEWYGLGDDGKPLAMLSLCERAKHSNFGSCHQCSEDKKAWIDFRTRKRGDGAGATAIDARAFKERLFTHIREVKLQRTGMMRLAQECASHSGWLFGYDDACGSNFLYWPTAVREDGKDASRYKYRFAMQCNLYPGTLLRCSLILPCVVKGGNFGCTAHFSTLIRLEELGKLGSDDVRQTDSGPDNDCKTTHAYHWSLVHFGVLQKSTWGRLLPKHSHNFADRVNSMVKEVIWPQRGTGGGCSAPWDFADVMKQALKTQRGTQEFAWHLNNTNWGKWFEDSHSIHKRFEDFSDHRFWVYEYDPNLPEHGYVRVTYKEAVTTSESEERPYEFKPVDLVDGQYRPKPQGLIFMQDARYTPNCSHPDARFPTLADNPGVDAWKLGKPTEGVPEKSTWQQERVFRDILEHRMLNFSADQQQQWHALHRFHQLYETADSVPSLPITLQSPAGSSFSMDHGTPFDWHAAWSKLAWRFDRPHKPSTAAAPAGPSAAPAGSSSSAAAPPPKQVPPRAAALVNKVGGANAPHLEKVHAAKDEAVCEKAQSLQAHGVDAVVVGKLYFAVTPEPEGEMSVGLVRIEKQHSDQTVDYSWWKRKSDSDRWPDTPTFEPFMPMGKVEKHTKVGLETLLSVPVELTPASAKAYKPNAKSIAGQTVRLLKSCVMLLRAFLKIHRKDLIAEIESEEEGEEEGEEEVEEEDPSDA